MKKNSHNVNSETTIVQSKIENEFRDASNSLEKVVPAVTMFGSARINKNDKYYQLAENIAFGLSNNGFNIFSGGGSGIMEASNKGAFHGKAKSIGLNISLPHEQTPNHYQDLSIEFNYFFTRKIMFIKYASAFVVLPGGFGTLDELLQVLTLIQTNKIKQVPIILIGSDFWSGLLQWIETALLKQQMIQKDDLHLIPIMNDADQVINYVTAFYQKDGNEYCIQQKLP